MENDNNKKYITVNGVLMKNPNYQKGNSPSAPKPPQPATPPLAVVSSVDDLLSANEVQVNATGIPVTQAFSTEASIDIMQDPELLAEFRSPVALDSSEILEKLGEEFAKYEVPVGMLNKLLAIRERQLNFIIDDSGSMSAPSDVELKDGTTYLLRGMTPREGQMMTRWQEVQDRLHIMVDLLAYIPTTKPMTISFLNSPQKLNLDRSGLTPDEYKERTHALITDAFTTNRPSGTTPIYRALNQSFNETSEPSIHYLFTDGVPDDPTSRVKSLIKNRKEPNKNALTLISCTNMDSEVEWMKGIDEDALFVAELDDFNDEKNEVLRDQGPGMPYTKGLWIICQLVAAVNPHDLDAIDENLPFTKYTLDNVLGRKLNPQEYQYYFENNPNASLYLNEYPRFLNEEVVSKQIINKSEQTRRERSAGYSDTSRGVPSSISHVSRVLQPHTDAATQRLAASLPSAPPSAPSSIAPHASFIQPVNATPVTEEYKEMGGVRYTK